MAKKPAKKKPTKAPAKVAKPVTAMPTKDDTCCTTTSCCAENNCACDGTCGCGCGPTLFGCHVAGLFTLGSTWTAALVAFIILWGFDFLWHGKLMMETYRATAPLWRPEAEMQALWQYCLLYHGLLALVVTVLFKLMGSGACFLKGIKHGVLIMAPLALSTLVVYMSQTIPTDILKMWALGYLAQGAVVGFALALAANLSSHKACCADGGCCNM